MCTVLNSLNAIQSIHKNEPHRRLHHSIYFCKSSSFIAFDPIFTEIHENAIPHVRRTNDIFSQTSEYAMSKVSNYVNAIQSIHENVHHWRLQHSIYLRKSSSLIASDPKFTEIHDMQYHMSEGRTTLLKKSICSFSATKNHDKGRATHVLHIHKHQQNTTEEPPPLQPNITSTLTKLYIRSTP
jgi:hypothetical protein